MADSFSDDIETIAQVTAVPTILEVVCRTTGMGFAAVARVTEDRWIACAVHDDIAFGLKPGDELAITTTICNEIRESREAVFIEDVAHDPIYHGHPTPAIYGFRSYVSAPIILSGGRFFGTLCAIDPSPAPVKRPEIAGMFKLFAELIAFHMEAHEQVAAAKARLADERETSEVREQFIAVLGHDLRNPLASIEAGTHLLAKSPLDERAHGIVATMRRSTARMGEMIDNILDFARGRLGGGLSLSKEIHDLAPVLNHVVEELRGAWPARSIATEFALLRPVRCDAARIGQLLSNLLANALTHGAPEGPVSVRANADYERFELSVANSGEPIPPETIGRLFEPYKRGDQTPNQHGLGLGLYIAREIARAHGGSLTVASTTEQTRFTFSMPV